MEQVNKQTRTTDRDDEAIDELPEVIAERDILEATDEFIDAIDDVLADGDGQSDDVLLDTVRTERVQRVRRHDAGRLIASGQARAWTMGGSVD